MDKLKTKGSLTIVATVCVMLSLVAGFGFLPAASGFNCLWHAMFPQLRDEPSQPLWHRGLRSIAEPPVKARTNQ